VLRGRIWDAGSSGGEGGQKIGRRDQGGREKRGVRVLSMSCGYYSATILQSDKHFPGEKHELRGQSEGCT